jgi:hypothetical protein
MATATRPQRQRDRNNIIANQLNSIPDYRTAAGKKSNAMEEKSAAKEVLHAHGIPLHKGQHYGSWPWYAYPGLEPKLLDLLDVIVQRCIAAVKYIARLEMAFSMAYGGGSESRSDVAAEERGVIQAKENLLVRPYRPLHFQFRNRFANA